MKIELTETEITHIMDALDARIEDLTGCLATVGDPEIEDEIAELTELCMDLFEALGRKDDDWGRENDAVPDAAVEFIQAGIDAREEAKATSRAAQRREQALSDRLMGGTTDTLANDPIDW